MSMTDNEYSWHLRMSRDAGRASACTGKVNYKSEDTAERVKDTLNGRGTQRRELEHYPCYWCQGWHIGGKMQRTEEAKR